MTPLIPQEVYLIERYIALDYFGNLRDTWGEMVDHLQRCLDAFMNDLPSDYRRRPLPEQPDAVWGERVIPNFRTTFEALCDGFVKLSHGDLLALGHSHRTFNDFKGQSDFWSGWLSQEDNYIYRTLLNHSMMLSGNIVASIIQNWDPGDLTEKYDEIARGPLLPPISWPSYELVKNILVNSGQEVIQTGIYLPNTENSCAEFLYAKRPAPEAQTFIGTKDLFIPGTEKKYGEKRIYENRSCVWTLIKRGSDAEAVYAPPTLNSQATHRVPAGNACPQAGYYITPARIDARRKFNQGEIMPSFDSTYGEIIWQWDVNQNA